MNKFEKIQDLAIWMTGCGYDFTQHEHYMKNKHLLTEELVKDCSISSVSQQREQLISFFNWYKDDSKELSNNETIVDAYLEEINYT